MAMGHAGVLEQHGLYSGAANDVLKAYTLTNGLLGGAQFVFDQLVRISGRDSVHFSEWEYERYRVGDRFDAVRFPGTGARPGRVARL